MSERRQARARVKVALATSDGVPRCLVIGRLIEVWGLPDLADVQSIRAASHARQRFGTVRRWWLQTSGIEDQKGWKVIPAGAAWSLEYLTAHGKAADATARLARADCTVSDLPDLAADAARLHDLACREDVAAVYQHLKESTS